MPQARHMRDQPPADGGGRADWLLQRRQHGRSRADATAICGLVSLLRLRRVLRVAAARVCRHEPSGLAAAALAAALPAEPRATATAALTTATLAAAFAALTTTPVVDGYAHGCLLRGRDVLRDGSSNHLGDKHVSYGRWRHLHASRCAARWKSLSYRGCEDSLHMRSARHDRVHDGWLQLGLQQLHGRRQRKCIHLARKRRWGQNWCLLRRIR